MYLRHLTVKLALYACDQCGKEFKRYIKDVSDLQLCSRECVSLATRTGGVIWQKTSKTCVKRFGVVTPFASHDVREKIQKTLVERYGVLNVLQNESVRQKIANTCKERYGVENVLASKQIREKARHTLRSNYGVDAPQQSQEIQERTKRTNLERHAVANTLQLSYARERCNSVEAHMKRHETMKRNGTYGKSRSEDLFYRMLCEFFSTENVVRQVTINKWSIDFYIKCIDNYVQFDGVYWHGLDRPIEVIAEHKTKRDVQIHKKWLTDREQDRWFREHGLNLIRVTDVLLQNRVCHDQY